MDALPQLDSERRQLLGIVTGVLGKITLEDGPGNDPDGSCGGVDPRHSLVPRVPRSRWTMEVGAVREHLDLRVPDRVALDEIELYAEVLSAVAVSDRPLTAEELDTVLGIASVSRSRAGD
jgi:hypothetical protein